MLYPVIVPFRLSSEIHFSGLFTYSTLVLFYDDSDANLWDSAVLDAIHTWQRGRDSDVSPHSSHCSTVLISFRTSFGPLAVFMLSTSLKPG